MKTVRKTVVFALVAVLTLAVVGAASASDGTTPFLPGGPGGLGGRGRGLADPPGTGVPLEMNINLSERADDLFNQALADALGISLDEFLTRHEAGETFAQMALDLGFAQEEIADLMATARQAALDQAVADGVLTQEEADWLASRGNFGAGPGAGLCLEDCPGTPVQQGTSPGFGRGNRGNP